jgi:hypothetical protein
MRSFLIVNLLILVFACNLFAEELYIGYLKPFQETFPKKTFIRIDPMAEPKKSFGLDFKNNFISKHFELKGILYNPNDKRAFINGELYKEGDLIDNYKVQQIFSDKVILVGNGKKIELTID